MTTTLQPNLIGQHVTLAQMEAAQIGAQFVYEGGGNITYTLQADGWLRRSRHGDDEANSAAETWRAQMGEQGSIYAWTIYPESGYLVGLDVTLAQMEAAPIGARFQRDDTPATIYTKVSDYGWARTYSTGGQIGATVTTEFTWISRMSHNGHNYTWMASSEVHPLVGQNVTSESMNQAADGSSFRMKIEPPSVYTKVDGHWNRYESSGDIEPTHANLTQDAASSIMTDWSDYTWIAFSATEPQSDTTAYPALGTPMQDVPNQDSLPVGTIAIWGRSSSYQTGVDADAGGGLSERSIKIVGGWRHENRPRTGSEYSEIRTHTVWDSMPCSYNGWYLMSIGAETHTPSLPPLPAVGDEVTTGMLMHLPVGTVLKFSTRNDSRDRETVTQSAPGVWDHRSAGDTVSRRNYVMPSRIDSMRGEVTGDDTYLRWRFLSAPGVQSTVQSTEPTGEPDLEAIEEMKARASACLDRVVRNEGWRPINVGAGWLMGMRSLPAEGDTIPMGSAFGLPVGTVLKYAPHHRTSAVLMEVTEDTTAGQTASVSFIHGTNPYCDTETDVSIVILGAHTVAEYAGPRDFLHKLWQKERELRGELNWCGAVETALERDGLEDPGAGPEVNARQPLAVGYRLDSRADHDRLPVGAVLKDSSGNCYLRTATDVVSASTLRSAVSEGLEITYLP